MKMLACSMAGLGMVAAGVWMLSPAWALIVVGSLLLAEVVSVQFRPRDRGEE